MSWTGALGAAGSIKNLDKVVLYIVGFLTFIGIMIVIGVAGLNSSISFVIGLFIIGLGGYGMVRGKWSWQLGIAMIAVGAVVTVINPSAHLTLGDTPVGTLYRELGLTCIRLVNRIEVIL